METVEGWLAEGGWTLSLKLGPFLGRIFQHGRARRENWALGVVAACEVPHLTPVRATERVVLRVPSRTLSSVCACLVEL